MVFVPCGIADILRFIVIDKHRKSLCFFIKLITTNILKELVDFGISRYKRDYSKTYGQTDLVLYQKYTYEDVCRLLNWEQNEVPLNIGGYKFDKLNITKICIVNRRKYSFPAYFIKMNGGCSGNYPSAFHNISPDIILVISAVSG